MAYEYDTRKWQNSRSIKERFSLRKYQDRHPELLQDLIEYLNSLHKATKAYCDIFSPEQPDAFDSIENPALFTEIIVWSRKLSRLGMRANLLPLLIAVRLKAEDQGQTYLKVVELCEKFDFRVYQWLRYRSNAAESMFYRFANQFYNNPNSERLQDDIARAILNYCSDKRFQEQFGSDNSDWYHGGGLTYFLYEYENHLAGGRPVQMSWETIDSRPKASSIEHILPQTPSDPYWQARFSEEKHERWVHDIGNLTLTYDNSSLSNKSFPDKKGQPGQISRYAVKRIIDHELVQMTVGPSHRNLNDFMQIE